MLLMSAILSGLGLYAMSRSSGGMLYVAATIYALGVCFFWPTMLGYVSETFRDTGAVGLAIMGGAGMLGVSFALPILGRSYDRGIALRLPAGADPTTAPAGVQAAAGLHTLGHMAVLPAVVFVVFLFLLLTRRNHKPA